MLSDLEALEERDARLVFIDSLRDPQLPALDALYIGGGFPELFLEALSQNRSLRRQVRQAAEDGLPIYAECGGLMYLSRSIGHQGQSAEMVGVLPCEVEMTARPQGHGYVLAECVHPNPYYPPGVQLRGHEFHNSRLVGLPEDWPTALRLERGAGLGGQRDGLIYRNVFASYLHLHIGGARAWAEGLMALATSH